MSQVNPRLCRRYPGAPAYVALRRRLIAARTAARLTQAELASRLSRPQSFVAKVEVGERYLDAVELVAVCHILDLDLAILAEELLEELDAD